MSFLKHMLGGSSISKQINALNFKGKSLQETWGTRRDAAAELGGSGQREAIAPLYASMNIAIETIRSRHAELNRSELDCLLSWNLNLLVIHTDAEWASLSERTGTAMTIIHIGEFEWAWATAIIHAEALAKLGEKAAPQQLIAELQKLEGAQWKNAETMLIQAKAL